MVRRKRKRPTSSLHKFDQSFFQKYQLIAGVDEAGRGPLAGPVVAAAVILPESCKIAHLNDSKQLTAERREFLFIQIQKAAIAFGIGIVDSEEIDRVNILQASYAAMRLALAQLNRGPEHVLVDGYPIPAGPMSQTGVIGGDGKSALIAAASILAKVTRDRIMLRWDEQFPAYGFKKHKGYGTPQHMAALKQFGPSPIHRWSFAPVRLSVVPVEK